MGEPRILIVGAHPDDVEFGMGGSVLTFADRGAEIALCVLTRGEVGTYGTPDVREREMRDAAAFSGAGIRILDLMDCQVADTYPNRLKVARVIREVRPHLVFAPYHTNLHGHRDGASHPDHLAAGAITRAAARFARFRGIRELEGQPWDARALIYYIVPRTTSPTFLVDVSPVMDRWEELCRRHESQLAIRDGKIMDVLRNLRRSWGVLGGMEYAEALQSDDPVPLDLRAWL